LIIASVFYRGDAALARVCFGDCEPLVRCEIEKLARTATGQNRLFAGTKFRPVFLQKPTVWAAMLSQRFSACSLLRHRPCLAGGISGLGRARGHALLWKWPELARNTVLSLIQTSPFTKSDDLVIFRTVSRRKAVRVCTKNHRSPSARPRIRS